MGVKALALAPEARLNRANSEVRDHVRNHVMSRQ